jgi:hypothetical protein
MVAKRSCGVQRIALAHMVSTKGWLSSVSAGR